MENTFYIWNAADNQYRSWNGLAGTKPEAGLIAPWQGFWVKDSAAAPSLTVTDEVRSAGGILYKTAEKEPTPVIRFTLESEKKSSQTILMLSEHAYTEKDARDAYKLQSLNAAYLYIFTTLENGTALDINALPADLDEVVSIDLDYELV